MSAPLTARRLHELLQYDPETGVFLWRVYRSSNARAGSVAGSLHCKGYWHLSIDGRTYLAHRLVWLYMTGAWPVDEIDHRDTNRLNNRWLNLRDATTQINRQNLRAATRRNKTAGLLGVRRYGRGKPFKAQITVNGSGVYLGSFDTAELAHEAYVNAKRELHAGNTL